MSCPVQQSVEVSIFEKKKRIDFVEFLAHAWKEPSVYTLDGGRVTVQE